MIYVASPYTHVSGLIRELRYLKAEAYVAHQSRLGRVVFSPIVHYHHLAIRHTLPHDYSFWRDINQQYLLLADEIHVLKLEGWEISRGVSDEIKTAEAANIPIQYVPYPKGHEY